MNTDKTIREQLHALLNGGNAHMSFVEAVSGFPLKEINRRLPNASYTVWHLLEHMRIAQWDILEFVRNPDHASPDFPDGYWPKVDTVTTPAGWRKTIKEFSADLVSPIPHARDYTILREVLLAADHNAYHIAEIVTIRRLLDLKPIREY
jgi:hypothetical protein